MTEVTATFEEKKGKPRILVKWGYTPDFQSVISRLKSNTNGARFQRSAKVWAMPATVDNCHGLRRAFGEDLTIKKPLAKWYVENKAVAESQEALSYGTDAELVNLPLSAPLLAATLRPDQRAGVKWIADGYRGAGLIADKPGLGKTLQAIGGALEADLKGPILVVCPKISVRNVWLRELRKWTNEPVYAARGTRAQREAALEEFHEDQHERKWLIIVAEMLRVQRKPNDTGIKANAKKRGRVAGYEYPDLFNVKWAAIFADESQRLLGSLSVAKSNLMGEGLTHLPQDAEGRRYAISGTPFGKGGRVQGMFGTLHWLWPDEHTSFWNWAKRWFEVDEVEIGRGKTAMKVGGLRDGMEGEEFLKTLGPRILRRTKEEVLKDLPPKQYVEVLCEMGPKQKRQYRQLGADAEVNIPGGVLIANGVLAELTRAKQIANGELAYDEDGEVVFTGESSKVDALMEKLEARGPDTKVIISSRFNAFLYGAVIPALEKAGYEYHLLTGATTDRVRDAAMDAFQGEGGPSIFVLNSKAGGVSINLDAADEVHCLDELDNPEDNEQLEDRAHRASRNHQVTIYYYRTEGTVDVNIAESVENKRVAQFEVLDGRRGIQDVRNWIKYREPSE
jgi:SNF2 family DNA or RNA helicase